MRIIERQSRQSLGRNTAFGPAHALDSSILLQNVRSINQAYSMRRSYTEEVTLPRSCGWCTKQTALNQRSTMHPGTPQPVHPRLSVLSTISLPTGGAGDRVSLSTPPPAARLSLPASNSTLTLAPRSSIATSVGTGPVPNIYDRNLNKTRTAEVSAAAFAFLFSEMIQYTQKRVSGIGDLERRCVPPHTPQYLSN